MQLDVGRGLEGAAGLLDARGVLQFDHRFVDVGVHACEHTRQQLIVEQHGLGGHQVDRVLELARLRPPGDRRPGPAEPPAQALTQLAQREVAAWGTRRKPKVAGPALCARQSGNPIVLQCCAKRRSRPNDLTAYASRRTDRVLRSVIGDD